MCSCNHIVVVGCHGWTAVVQNGQSQTRLEAKMATESQGQHLRISDRGPLTSDVELVSLSRGQCHRQDIVSLQQHAYTNCVPPERSQVVVHGAGYSGPWHARVIGHTVQFSGRSLARACSHPATARSRTDRGPLTWASALSC